jgi:hypothetical protein
MRHDTNDDNDDDDDDNEGSKRATRFLVHASSVGRNTPPGGHQPGIQW